MYSYLFSCCAQDALQAQMVIKKMSEIMDSNKSEETRDNAEPPGESAEPASDPERAVEVSQNFANSDPHERFTKKKFFCDLTYIRVQR